MNKGGGMSSSEDRPDCPLTPWQQNIMNLVCEGYTNPEIARTVFCAMSTLKNTLSEYIFPKLQARNRTQAAVRFILSREKESDKGSETWIKS